MPTGRFSFFSLRRGTQWTICLMVVWFLLNMLDIVTTYQALSTGRAMEMNPVMALFVGAPLLLITAKMLLAFAAAKIIERMCTRSAYLGAISLIVLNTYVALVCANNFVVWLGW